MARAFSRHKTLTAPREGHTLNAGVDGPVGFEMLFSGRGVMAYRALVLPILGLVLLGAFWGCSRNPQNRQAVSGSVTLDGAPLAQGSIRFQAEKAGGIGSGALVTDGQYSIPTDKGLTAGKYKVMIFASKPGSGGPAAGALPGDPAPPAGELIPPEYNVKSDKFIEVTADGPTQFDFSVVTKR